MGEKASGEGVPISAGSRGMKNSLLVLLHMCKRKMVENMIVTIAHGEESSLECGLT